jgi:hypothetical protein
VLRPIKYSAFGLESADHSWSSNDQSYALVPSELLLCALLGGNEICFGILNTLPVSGLSVGWPFTVRLQ